MLILMLASLLTMSFALRLSAQDLHRTLLPKVVNHWGKISSSAIKRNTSRDGMYTGLLWEGDCAEDPSHPVDCVLTPDGPDASKTRIPHLLCPGELKMETHHLQIDSQPTPARVEAKLAKTQRPTIPLPARLLFEAPDLENMSVKKEAPIAALVTEQKGLLLYRDQRYNNGLSPHEAVEDFFKQHNYLRDKTAIAEAAFRAVMKQALREGQTEEILTVIEV